jgi:hypothetical protein
MSTKEKSLDEIHADYLRVTAEIEQRIAGGQAALPWIACHKEFRDWYTLAREFQAQDLVDDGATVATAAAVSCRCIREATAAA